MQSILADLAVSVSELKKNPTAVLGASEGPVALLSHNRVVGYVVPAEAFEAIMGQLDDRVLIREAWVRLESGAKPVQVALEDLIAEAESYIRDGR